MRCENDPAFPRTTALPRRPLKSIPALAAAAVMTLGMALLLFLPAGSAHAEAAETLASETLERTVERLDACGVPGALTSRLLALALEGELARGDAESIARTLVLACDQKLPVGPFADKTAEGLSKGVPAARICAALSAKLDDYVFMRGLLLPLASAGKTELPPDLVIFAGEAPALGLHRETALALAEAHPDAPPAMLVTGLRLTALMHQAGYDSALIREIVDTGLIRRTLTPEWENLSSVSILAGKRGVSEEEVKKAACAALENGESLRSLMTRLGATPRDPSGAGNTP